MSLPDDEIASRFDHYVLFVHDVFLLSCFNDVVFLHLLQGKCSRCVVAQLDLNYDNDDDTTTIQITHGVHI